jgi:hypothetical protein
MFKPYVKMVHKILILGQNGKRFLTLRYISKNHSNPKPICPKKIPTPGQYAYAKLILPWDKLSWPEV